MSNQEPDWAELRESAAKALRGVRRIDRKVQTIGVPVFLPLGIGKVNFEFEKEVGARWCGDSYEVLLRFSDGIEVWAPAP